MTDPFSPTERCSARDNLKALGLLALGVFVLLTVAVHLQLLRAADRFAALLFEQLSWPVFDIFASILNLIGAAEVLLLAAIGLSSYLFFRRQAGIWSVLPLVGLGFGTGLEILFKLTVSQPPVGAEFHRTAVFSYPFASLSTAYSYPSGHVFRSVFVGVLAILVWRPGRWARVAVYVFLATMIVTRIYLGEHWLADTIGGALLGVGLAAIIAEALRVLGQRHSSYSSLFRLRRTKD